MVGQVNGFLGQKEKKYRKMNGRWVQFCNLKEEWAKVVQVVL